MFKEINRSIFKNVILIFLFSRAYIEDEFARCTLCSLFPGFIQLGEKVENTTYNGFDL